MSVLIVGSVALDTVKTPFGKVNNALGGSASYSSVSASFFQPVNLVAVVGNDFSGEHVEFLKNRGINLEGLVKAEGETFRWEGEYGWDFSDPKTISTHLNVFADFNPKLPKSYTSSKYIFLANIDPEIQENVLSQVAKPKLIACDTMNYWIENKRKHLLKLLKKVDVFFLNGSESKELTQEASIFKAGKAIIKLGPKIVVIKKGEHGVLLFSKNSVFATPAFLLESVFDPTGAGDTFAGGFMGYLAGCNKCRQVDLRKAVIYGNIMATFAVEDFSLRRLGFATMADVNRRIKEFRKITCYEL